jgi:hypothetical protein
MKTCKGVYVQIHIFLTLALVRGEWSASLPGWFTSSEKAPITNRRGGWVGPRTCMDNMEK